MKNIPPFILLFIATTLSAQNSSDVLRYSIDNTQGTARFQAMSGAFGALGGDLSSLNTNPAGSAVFKNSLFTISGTAYDRENSSTYFNTNSANQENYIDINQIGGVLVLKSAGSSNWKKIALAINYDIANNFDNTVYASGNSPKGIDNYFLNFAQGTTFGSILTQDGEYLEDAYLDIGSTSGFSTQQAFLGYYGGIIDPVDETDDNTEYVKTADYTSVNQDYLKSTSGYNSKLTLNLASQYQDNLFIGASLNFHNVLYDEYKQFTETGYSATSPIQRTTFDSSLHTEGNGFSLNIGAIAKLNNNVRIGGSYQSPTWYRLTDDFSQRITSDLADEDIDYINFNVVNLFDTYTIKTPSKLTGSLAIIFGKDGLLSFDYDYQDMSQAELKPTSDSNFSAENENIQNNLSAISTLRIGGEYRISKVSLRAGYRYEQSPYADSNLDGDLTGYSAGIGFNFGGSRLDLAINRAEKDTKEYLFSTGLDTPAIVNRIHTNASLSYTINF